jgi:hypothetical protein
MQDRIARIDETSCTARPDHTKGSKRAADFIAGGDRSTPETGRRGGVASASAFGQPNLAS